MISRDSSQDETSVGNGYEHRLQETWESPSASVLFQVTWVGCREGCKQSSGLQTRGSLYITVSGGGYIIEMSMNDDISITRRTYCSHYWYLTMYELRERSEVREGFCPVLLTMNTLT